MIQEDNYQANYTNLAAIKKKKNYINIRSSDIQWPRVAIHSAITASSIEGFIILPEQAKIFILFFKSSHTYYTPILPCKQQYVSVHQMCIN